MFKTSAVFSKIINNLAVIPHKYISILGVILSFLLVIQLVSGTMISFSTINDFGLLTISRSNEDLYDLYTDDFFWLHQRGVDLIFLFLMLHLLRKLYLQTSNYLQLSAWKSGSFMFLIIHLVIFLGLVLCCTHLSDITLKIAANILQTLTFKYGNLGYWVFTDHNLNTDTLIRVMYLHYTVPFLLTLLIILHLLDMHFGYKNNYLSLNIIFNYNWFGFVVKNEITFLLLSTSFFFLLKQKYHLPNEPLSFELFMWGDVGLITDVRFLGVAPHWYFRSYMGWLLFCPHHYIGIFGLIYFFLAVYFFINISFLSKKNKNNRFFTNLNPSNYSIQNIWVFFLLSIVYTASYLPCGKYFTELEGNLATTLCYLFILLNIRYNLNFKVFNYFNKITVILCHIKTIPMIKD